MRGALTRFLTRPVSDRSLPGWVSTAVGVLCVGVGAVQAAYAKQRCSLGGGPLEYKTYPGRDHVDVVTDDSPLIPDLIAWTLDGFNGKPAPTTC